MYENLLANVPTDLWIGGKWRKASDGARFDVIDPATENKITSVASASVEDAKAAVDAASEAFAGWAERKPRERGEILRKAYEVIMAQSERLAKLITLENGKALSDSRGEVAYAAEFFRWYAEEAVRNIGNVSRAPSSGARIFVQHKPAGVAVLVTPWNFPAAMATRKIGPALAAGCPVVLKPASETPLTMLALMPLLEEAGVPAGVVNVIPSRRSGAVVSAMLHDPRVRVVSFTGSTEVGRTVSEKAAPSFKKVHLEMGGKNVIMIMEDANLELAVEGCLWGGFGTTGQRCTAASRVVVHEQVYDRFLEQFVARTRALRVGDPLDPRSQMGPSVSRGQLETVMKYVEIGQQEGAKLACGGHRLASGAYAKGFFHEPTIFADVAPSMRVAQEEIFGPVVSVIPCRSFDEAVAIGNGVQYGLSASIYTQDVNRAFSAMRDMYTGIFYVNAPTIGAEVHLPFGGTKATGNGHREAGTAALDVFSEWKSVYVDFSGRLQRAQIDTAEL